MLGYTAWEITERGFVSADFGMDYVCCWNSVAYLTWHNALWGSCNVWNCGLLGQNLKPKTLDLFTPHFLAKTAALCLRWLLSLFTISSEINHLGRRRWFAKVMVVAILHNLAATHLTLTRHIWHRHDTSDKGTLCHAIPHNFPLPPHIWHGTIHSYLGGQELQYGKDIRHVCN